MKIHIIFTEAGELRISFRQKHPQDMKALKEFMKINKLDQCDGKHSNFYIGVHTPSCEGDQIGLDVQNGSGVASYTMTGSLSVKKFTPFRERESQNEILYGKRLTLKAIRKRCNKDWRYVWIQGGDQRYHAALCLDGKNIIKDSGEGGMVLQLVGIDSIEFTNQRQSSRVQKR